MYPQDIAKTFLNYDTRYCRINQSFFSFIKTHIFYTVITGMALNIYITLLYLC